MYLFHQKQFVRLYEDSFMRWVRFAQTYIGSRKDAENIVQDVFLYLWEHCDILSKIENIDGFMFTVVRNRCLNFLKHQSYNASADDSEELRRRLNIEALEQYESAFGALTDIDEDISRAIDALPEKCRQIFTMSKIEGLKYREIARQLEISENTVENQMAIALKKLREALKNHTVFTILFFV